MFNYSKGGFYFESDSVLNPGIQIYIGIKNSPYASLPDVLEYHRGEVVWRKEVKDSFFRFGYPSQIKTDRPHSYALTHRPVVCGDEKPDSSKKFFQDVGSCQGFFTDIHSDISSCFDSGQRTYEGR